MKVNKIQQAITEHFDVIADDVVWKSNSTDKIKITCKVCKVSHECVIRNVYAYVRDSKKPCRYCSKSKCRDAIEKYFEIISEGVKLTTNSTDIVKLKCLANGHEIETSVHNAYVCCTTNKVINKCTMCNKPYKHDFKTIVEKSGKFKSLKFESVKYFEKDDGGKGWRLYDAKLVTLEGKVCYIEFDGPEHVTNSKVIANDEFKEQLAGEEGVPLIRLLFDTGMIKITDKLIEAILEALE